MFEQIYCQKGDIHICFVEFQCLFDFIVGETVAKSQYKFILGNEE